MGKRNKTRHYGHLTEGLSTTAKLCYSLSHYRSCGFSIQPDEYVSNTRESMQDSLKTNNYWGD